MDEFRTCQRCGARKAIDQFPLGSRSGVPIKTCRTCMPQYRTKPDAKWLTDPLEAARRAWTRRNAEKRAAHKAIENAIARGDMARLPCQRCGVANAHAHHDDYSKPLDVMWLCHRHHMERHRELRAQQKEAA